MSNTPNKDYLFLLCDNYPVSLGELFIDDEMRILAPHFDKVFVLIGKQDVLPSNRVVPKNVEVFMYKETIGFSEIFNAIRYSSLFFNELTRARALKIEISSILIKTLMMHILRAIRIKREAKFILSKNRIPFNSIIFYAYWHDFKALALSFIRNSNTNGKATFISRAHGSDLYDDKGVLGYQPYKEYILKNLDTTYTVSENGKSYLLKNFGNLPQNKISVSRLGTRNNRPINLNKSGDKIVIASCSHFETNKRVELIADIVIALKKLHSDVFWVHFGWGPTENMVREKITNAEVQIEYTFHGFVENSAILDYYSNNYIDIFINTSLFEGVPVSIMEAHSAGIPVIATNAGGSAEAIDPNSGHVIEKIFDPNTVAETIFLYHCLSLEETTLKRLSAHNFWKENYEGKENFTRFYEAISTLGSKG